MVGQNKFLISMEEVWEKGVEEVVNTVAKLNCLIKDKGFCDIRWRLDRSRDKPCKVKEGGARDWVLENFWDVAYVRVVNLK